MMRDLDTPRVPDEIPRSIIALEERIELLQELYELASTVNSANGLDEIFQKSLFTLKRVLGAPRASILLFDHDGIMRFRAWTGLSDAYRQAVEGHSPWTRSTRHPAPVLIRDIEHDASLGSLRAAIHDEGIRSLGFFPLVYQGQLVGKFMVYYDRPHTPNASEIQLSQIIAHHISSGIGRSLGRQEKERLLLSEQASRRSAEEANRIKDEFLAVLSHELRTPIAAVLGWTQVLRDGGELDEKIRARALETIDRNTRLQARLIEDLLDVSRIISGTLSLDPRALDLRTVLAAVCESIRPASDVKKLSLEVDLGVAPALVFGDPARLQQIFWNLLTNAVKSTPEGGSVRVAVRSEGEDIVVSVTDTGRGIGPDFMPFVFERFRQDDGSSRRLQTGLGLGLSIVHDLVSLHHGRVDVASEGKGKGATFSVALPIHQESEAFVAADPPAPASSTLSPAPVAPPAAKLPDLQGFKVLLVEDDSDVREVLAILLQKCGAQVTRAASAVDALASYRRERPDVLVTDIGMPIQDGYDLLTQVRALQPGVRGHAPAIALTGYARGEDRRRAISAGFQMHIPKPVDPFDLARAVRSLKS